MPIFKPITLILIVFLFIYVQQSKAAEFCVTSSAELNFALALSENNDQSDVIRIAQGTYKAPQNGFEITIIDDYDFEISGGWTEFFGNPCGQQLTNNVFHTILDGLDGVVYNPIMKIFISSNSVNTDITVSNLYFINGRGGSQDSTGALRISTIFNDVSNITIEKNVFFNNTAENYAALNIFGGKKTVIRNNLFALNHSENTSAIKLVNNNAYGIYFTNNTVVSNTTNARIYSTSGLFFSLTGTSKALIANNLFWDNEHADLRNGDNGGYSYLRNNNFNAYYGTFDDELNNINIEPEFESGLLNYTPVYNSPLVNAGMLPPSVIIFPTFFNRWKEGTFDVKGNDRVQNVGIDIGSYESPHGDLIFIDGFE